MLENVDRTADPVRLRESSEGVAMKGRLLKLVMVLMVAAVFCAPELAGADIFMKEKQHTDGMTIMGQAQPPQDKISNVWISKDKMRMDHGDVSSIAQVVGEKVTIYHLNHANKTYTELVLGSNAPEDAISAMAGEMKVKVTPTSETKKIGNWNCKKYLQEMDMGMMPINSEVWASEEIKMPYADFYEKVSAAMSAGKPGMGVSSKAMLEEMKKIKGVPVLTVTNMTMMKNVNVKSSRELLEIKEDTAPAGTFDIPSGYKKQVMMQDTVGRKTPKMPGKQKPE
jgi:hypothetical protein